MDTTAEILLQTYNEVKKRFTGIDDLAHGWEHISRVYQLASHLAEQEDADRFVVGMAALLHDMGRAVPVNDSQHRHHADLSVVLAAELLERYNISEVQRESIQHAIIAHSFSKGIEPLTLEACIVRDADRLDGLGAIGILRWAITGTVRRSSSTQSYHPSDPFGHEHKLDDTLYLLDHFYIKLLKMAGTMTTRTGRALAQQRTDFMRQYLDELRRELNWEIDIR